MINYKKRSYGIDLITIIKQKWNRKIKGRACADGHKQRRYIKKEDVSSHTTVQLDSLVIALLIDAQEKIDVATADVVGAYLFPNLIDYSIVKISGTTSDIMCEFKI